jgi:aldose 1-epimerase
LAQDSPFQNFSGDPFLKYNISAPGINASFIPYGALTNLFVNDRNGIPQIVVLGYNDGEQYLNGTETIHNYFGAIVRAIVRRYANRMKNGTFSINGFTYHIPENENEGKGTLNGGLLGYESMTKKTELLSPRLATSSHLPIMIKEIKNFLAML